MKIYYLLFLLVAICFVSAFSTTANAQNNSGKKDKQVKLSTTAVELIEVTHSAKECGTQKSTTVRLRVISGSPVDVRRYVTFGKVKTSQDFINQKQGDEITSYVCNEGSTFRFVSRPAGSSEEFPKP